MIDLTQDLNTKYIWEIADRLMLAGTYSTRRTRCSVYGQFYDEFSLIQNKDLKIHFTKYSFVNFLKLLHYELLELSDIDSEGNRYFCARPISKPQNIFELKSLAFFDRIMSIRHKSSCKKEEDIKSLQLDEKKVLEWGSRALSKRYSMAKTCDIDGADYQIIENQIQIEGGQSFDYIISEHMIEHMTDDQIYSFFKQARKLSHNIIVEFPDELLLKNIYEKIITSIKTNFTHSQQSEIFNATQIVWDTSQPTIKKMAKEYSNSFVLGHSTKALLDVLTMRSGFHSDVSKPQFFTKTKNFYMPHINKVHKAKVIKMLEKTGWSITNYKNGRHAFCFRSPSEGERTFFSDSRIYAK